MRIPRRRTRRQFTQSSDWVVVGSDFETEGYTKSRSPQRNEDNMSSKQFANASTNGSASHLAFSEAGVDDHTRYYPSSTTATAAAAAMAIHVPPSNGGSSSTDTAGTDDTLPAHTTNIPFDTTTTTPTYPEPTYPQLAYPQLTQSSLDAHQQALNQHLYAHPGTMTNWADGAGMGTRLLGVPMGGVPYFYNVNALVAGRGGDDGSMLAADWYVVAQPTPADKDVVGTGTWCEDGDVGTVVRLFDGFGFEGGEGRW